MTHSRTPDFMPMLSPGRHRNPRKGACFMEMASYLAGERWSDHPDCTHSLLAAMAREVNDRVGDEARQELTPLIPQVVGVRGHDAQLAAWIALEAALTALPIVSMPRQRAVAVGVLRCEALLAELERRPGDVLSERATTTLARVPDAERWARDFVGIGWGSAAAFAKRGAPAIVHNSVSGIAQACVSNPDGVLVDLLRRTVAGCRLITGADAPAVVVPQPEPQPERWTVG
jgi:hypothetical protein